jgi:phosphoribosylformylglycinamidine synthase
MVLAVPPEHWPRLQAICEGQSIDAVCIGAFEATGCLQLFYGERMVAELDMDFLHDGIPRRHLEAAFKRDWRFEIGDGARPDLQSPNANHPSPDLTQALIALLAHPNICSKEQVVRVYDHEVQGATMVKPLVGAGNHGPGDATVLVPINDCRLPIADSMVAQSAVGNQQSTIRGVALSAGICPQFTDLDPYAMAWAAIDEAMRNAVAVGADPDQIAILDNFCWGNPNLPDRLGSLVRCAQGCYDAAIAYGTPFISGKDSLNNEYTAEDGRKHAIPGTLLISALGIVPDIHYATSMDLKQPGNLLYMLGDTRAELGGSHYSILDSNSVTKRPAIQNPKSKILNPPQPVPDAIERLRALHKAMAAGVVQSCHDCSEGGLGVAIAEVCLAGRLGAEIDLATVPGANEIAHEDVVLFSESLSRFIVEVRPSDAQVFEAAMAGMPYARIGHVTNNHELHIRGQHGHTVISAAVSDLEKAWRGSAEQGSSGDGAMGSKDTPSHPRSPAPTLPRSYASPRVLILHATGSNRDRDAALACELAGGAPQIVHVNQLLSGERKLLDYSMLVVPGGFSYGDDLGAGTLWALDLRYRLGEHMNRFITAGRPVLGICNGFQALVKAGLLPGAEAFIQEDQEPAPIRAVTLAPNVSAQFECRWVYLQPNPASKCLFTAGLNDMIYCPVAHGEGRVSARDERALSTLQTNGLIALTYVNADGSPAQYPGNPNGSVLDIAGLTNSAGNLLGLMPHPENHIFPWQHPRWQRGERGLVGLRLFENGVKSC